MGLGRAGDGAVGLVAMRLRCRVLPVPALAALVLLAGCNTVPEITGLVTGGAAGAATASPAVGFLVGVAVDAAASASLTYVTRTWHGAEQDAIARAAADVPEGGQVPWQIRHPLPIGNEHGQLRVVRVINSPLAQCKEIVFSVDEGKVRNSSGSGSSPRSASRIRPGSGRRRNRRWNAGGICSEEATRNRNSNRYA